MKKIIFIFILIVILQTINAQTNKISASVPNCDKINVQAISNGVCNTLPYVLAFEDNFDGTKLDFTKWNIPYQCTPRDFNHDNEKQFYANSGDSLYKSINTNIIVSNGTLKLRAVREPNNLFGSYVSNWGTTPPTVKYANFNYSSGQINSKRKFHHGKYEIRCKIPKGKGLWPAFWIHDGAVPNYNEVDVFEFWNESNLLGYDPSKLSTDANSNVLYSYNGSTTYKCREDNPSNTDYSQAFHVFELIWDEYRIAWIIDGIVVRILTYLEYGNSPVSCSSITSGTNYNLNKAFVQDSMNIFANLAIQYNNNNEPDDPNSFPKDFEIDYIRFYKQSDCLGRFNFNNVNQLSNISQYPNFYKGSKLTFGNNFIFPSNQIADFVARDEIKITDNTVISAGSNVDFKIDGTLCNDVLKISQQTPKFKYMVVETNDSIMKDEVISPYFDKNELKINSIKNLSIYNISIIDFLGKTIFYKNNIQRSDGNTFKIDNLAKGIYILKLKDVNSSYQFSKKMIYID